jgi:hypothetical protein
VVLMGLLGQPVAILDIENCEAFVQRTIDRSGIEYSASEREELLAEGLTILCELAGKYKPLPMRPGIDKQAGRFSGYAAMFLPRRLGDAWHKIHLEHRYVTNPDTGKRGWYYMPPVLSLDGLASGDADSGEHHLLNARALNHFCHATSVRVASGVR